MAPFFHESLKLCFFKLGIYFYFGKEIGLVKMRRKIPLKRQRLPNQPKKTGPKKQFTNEELKNVTLLTQLGATNDQIAEFFGVTRDTVYNWEKHPDYREARVAGGLYADMKVAASLYQRAIGFEYEEKELIRTKNGDFITKVHIKKVHPDVKAIIHWLRIRRREFWSVVDEYRFKHTHEGKINHIHESLQDIPVQELSKDAQALLFEITTKQLSNGNRDN